MSEGQSRFTLTQVDYNRFRDIVQERSGLHFPNEKRSLLTRGLDEALGLSSCANLSEYYELLRTSSSNNREWDQLVSVLTVGETYFLRNKGHFDALAKHILPEIIAQRQHFNRRIRIWSAGCATGEEPYSIAILLHELIPNISSWNILILATDINRAALTKAKEGLYGSWSFRGVEKRIQEQYFGFDGKNRYVIADKIKRMVTFDYLNLIEDNYPSLINNTHGMDVILCRNVTIYFSSKVTEMVLDRYYQCLIDGGWLIPGASEPNMVAYTAFEHKSYPGAVVYRRPKVARVKAKSTPWKSVFEPPVPVIEAPKPKPRPLPTTPPPPPPPDPYSVALEFLAAGQVENALVELYKKLDNDPDFIPTYYTLGKIYANKGNLEEAQHWCERAIKQDKLHPEPYYTLSMVYQGHGLLDQAIEALKRTLYLDPTFILAHFGLANLYQKQGNKKLAQRSLRNVQRLLAGKPREEPILEGDGLVAGRLQELVEIALGNGGG